ncbi:MAG TPA: hypothetical protein VGF44_03420 [Terriglobales bacterium]|jgi:hypothetical protein
MDSFGTKAGWTLSLAGFLLLICLGNLGMVAVLVPLAAVLAIGAVMLLGSKDGHVTHGLK